MKCVSVEKKYLWSLHICILVRIKMLVNAFCIKRREGQGFRSRTSPNMYVFSKRFEFFVTQFCNNSFFFDALRKKSASYAWVLTERDVVWRKHWSSAQRSPSASTSSRSTIWRGTWLWRSSLNLYNCRTSVCWWEIFPIWLTTTSRRRFAEDRNSLIRYPDSQTKIDFN